VRLLCPLTPQMEQARVIFVCLRFYLGCQVLWFSVFRLFRLSITLAFEGTCVFYYLTQIIFKFFNKRGIIIIKEKFFNKRGINNNKRAINIRAISIKEVFCYCSFVKLIDLLLYGLHFYGNYNAFIIYCSFI